VTDFDLAGELEEIEDIAELRKFRTNVFRMIRDAERTEGKLRRDRVAVLQAAQTARHNAAHASRSTAGDNEALKAGRGPQRYAEQERLMRERVRSIDENLNRNAAAQDELRELLEEVDQVLADAAA